MTSFPNYPRERTVRLGAVVLAVLLTAYGLAWLSRSRRDAAWDWTPPAHPGVISAITSSGRRIGGVKTYRGAVKGEIDAVAAWYADALKGKGWTPLGEQWADRRGGVTRTFERGRFRLDLAVRPEQPETDGAAQVAMMLTDLPPPPAR